MVLGIAKLIKIVLYVIQNDCKSMFLNIYGNLFCLFAMSFLWKNKKGCRCNVV